LLVVEGGRFSARTLTEKFKKKVSVMKKITGVLIVLALVLVSAKAVEVNPRATLKYGGTHCVTVKYSDFTETTVNTAETLTWNVLAKQGVELVAMELVTAFDSGDTNYTGSCLVTVGDGTDADLYLTSTELASDGTEVFWKFNPSYASTVTVTATTTNIVYLNAATNTVTNTLVSAVSAVAGPALLGKKVYTADDTVDFTFTPNSDEALTGNTAGEVRFYFRWLD
jgi:hypothetical protein